ncbi:uncharacterized protein TM35_000401210 [Trypanosoma theileri]|uniref:Uncharacterized protein n=1 Tax=Trypanosoma theileri TaxID=67003 RepID=A0A1X0NJA9_9TRYP|nr:uncharacterized protein TM35_000401210 [Trypanosoma theileri]ORC84854.1 hypothetical protein TM35_000401210 [Trypanosoma theileri]
MFSFSPLLFVHAELSSSGAMKIYPHLFVSVTPAVAAPVVVSQSHDYVWADRERHADAKNTWIVMLNCCFRWSTRFCTCRSFFCFFLLPVYGCVTGIMVFHIVFASNDWIRLASVQAALRVSSFLDWHHN